MTFHLLQWTRLVALVICIKSSTSFPSSEIKNRILLQRRLSHQLTAFQVSPFTRFTERFRSEAPAADPVLPSVAENQAIPESKPTLNTSRAQSSLRSMPLIRAIWFNQASLFILASLCAIASSVATTGGFDLHTIHWTGDSNFHSLFDWRLNELRMLEGFLATIPLVVLGRALEKSDRRDASHVNFATTNMVISLFGRRKSIRDPEATDAYTVMAMSLLIALSTGLSEEIVFRGFLPSAIESLTHSMPIAIIGQATFFALAHLSPKASTPENKLVGGLQFINGLWYGALYMVTGGDVIPCIIAHALYDSHVLCETWNTINRQMDYTQDAFRKPMDITELEALATVQKQTGPALNQESLDLARRFFYAFDYEKEGSLCLSDVHRAVNYAFLKDKDIPPPEIVDDVFDRVLETRQDSSLHYPIDRLTVSEFLRLLFALKSKGAIAV